MAAQAGSPAPSGITDRFGLNVHHFEYEPEAFPLAAEVRARWVRLAAWWRIMERQPGVIDFGYLDRSVDAALANGLKVLIVFASVPAWANGSQPQLGIIDIEAAKPPNDLQSFPSFATAVATHFRGRVDAYEIWNEPNYKMFWNGKFDDFIDQILIPGAQAVKAADPSAKTLGPATDKKPGLFQRAALKAASHLDVLSCHLYYPEQTADVFIARATDHNESVKGLHKPLWVTELGVDSWVKGNDAQALELTKTLNGLRALPFLERLFFFQWRDGFWSVPKQKGWGLVSNSLEGFRRKKSFWALQDLVLQSSHRPGVAASPQPADGATNVPIDAPLRWNAGRDALSHRINLGTEEPLPFLGEQTATAFPASAAPREHGKTYLWRVDETGAGGSTTGTLWRFTVEEDPAATIADVIVRVQGSKPFFLVTAQGQGCSDCAPVRALVLPGTPAGLAPGAWTVGAPAAGPTDLTFLRPAGPTAPGAGAGPRPLTITLSNLRPGATYQVFGRFITVPEQDNRQAAVRMGLSAATMTLCSAGSTGATVVRKEGRWQEREVLIGSAQAANGRLTVQIDAKGVPEAAGWSGLRLHLAPAA
jgi:hypothetical protein